MIKHKNYNKKCSCKTVGTYKIRDEEICFRALDTALSCGYRLFGKRENLFLVAQ
jgi:diketogulonate reductase-like aldo/keto reductase